MTRPHGVCWCAEARHAPGGCADGHGWSAVVWHAACLDQAGSAVGMDDGTEARPDDQDPTLARLEDQLAWYDGNARAAQQPVQGAQGQRVDHRGTATGRGGRQRTGVGGAARRCGCGARGRAAPVSVSGELGPVPGDRPGAGRECYLYLAAAGRYDGSDRHAMLAERIEGLISQEHARWTESQQQPIDAPTHRASA